MEFREDLQAHVSGLSYDFDEHLGVLSLPKHNVSDMTGAIKLFKRIDSKVRHVVVTSAGVTVSVYTKDKSGWIADG